MVRVRRADSRQRQLRGHAHQVPGLQSAPRRDGPRQRARGSSYRVPPRHDAWAGGGGAGPVRRLHRHDGLRQEIPTEQARYPVESAALGGGTAADHGRGLRRERGGWPLGLLTVMAVVAVLASVLISDEHASLLERGKESPERSEQTALRRVLPAGFGFYPSTASATSSSARPSVPLRTPRYYSTPHGPSIMYKQSFTSRRAAGCGLARSCAARGSVSPYKLPQPRVRAGPRPPQSAAQPDADLPVCGLRRRCVLWTPSSTTSGAASPG